MTPTENTLIQAALAYQRQGVSVIPVNTANKVPLVPWATAQHTPATEERIAQWWQQFPQAKVGIVTGAVSGVVVVDCDSEQAYARALDRSPLKTLTAKTPRGYHLYFQHPGQPVCNKVGLLPAVDVRGDGGYVVAPPSEGYTWVDATVEMLPCPEWLFSGTTQPVSETATAGHTIKNGQRNDTLTQYVGKLVSLGLAPEDVLAVAQDRNARLCEPPLKKEEVQKIVQSIEATDGKNHPERHVDDTEQSVWGASLITRMQATPTERPALIEQLVLAHTAQMLYAVDGVGKSLIGLQLAVQATTSLAPVFGHFPVPRAVRTLYVQMERPIEEALERLRVMTPATHFDPSHLALTTVLQSLDIARADELAEALKRLEALIHRTLQTVDLIVIDPIYPLVGTGMTTDQDARPIIQLSTLLQARFGATVLLIHHANRGMRDPTTGARRFEDVYGSRFFTAHCTGIQKMTPTDDGSTLSLEKSTYGALAKTVALSYDPETCLSWLAAPRGEKATVVLEYLAQAHQSGKPITVADILKATGLAPSYLNKLRLDGVNRYLIPGQKGAKGKMFYTVSPDILTWKKQNQ